VKSGFLDNAGKPTTPNFLTALDSGNLDLTSMLPFPEQDEQERRMGDDLVAEVGALLDDRVDATEIDLTGELPKGLFYEFAKRGYFKLHIGPELGGLDLVPYNHFRFIERIASVSVGLAQSVSLSNSMSPVLLLPVLPPGPLRDFVRERVDTGIIGGFADTGPSGQNNQFPDLTATLTEDGGAYLLNGEKTFISNGPIANLLCVSATILDREPRKAGIAFVDTGLPGFSVRSKIDFMGLKGVPNGALAFDNVRVPREYVLADLQDDPQLAQSISTSILAGRMFVVSALATGVARRCLGWTRDFVIQRSIDGRKLGYYDEIQRMLATTLAEVYAMDTVAKRCLLGPSPRDRWFELLVAKNISTVTAWRIVDRTMSLMGGRGFETESSQRRRGLSPIPLERAFRDLRGLRITANVDFQLDNQTAWLLISRYYHEQHPIEYGAPTFGDASGIHLNPANRAHLEDATAQVREFRWVCQELVYKHPDPQTLARKEHLLILLSRIATELFTMCAVLARTDTSTQACADSGVSQDLADVFCTDARDRLAQLWRQLTVDYEPDHARLSRAWLTGSELDHLVKH
jgi:alkylation response protein AidB-like acyl-CoA dehydrogenase